MPLIAKILITYVVVVTGILALGSATVENERAQKILFVSAIVAGIVGIVGLLSFVWLA